MKRLLLLFLLAGIRLSAQHDSTPAPHDSLPPNSSTAAPAAVHPKPGELRVVGFNILYKDSANRFAAESKNCAELGDYIAVKVRGLDSLYKMEDNVTKWVTLYMNDIPMNIYPMFPSKHDSVLIFRLERDTFSEKGWDVFYDYPRKHIEDIKLSVGLDNGYRIATDVYHFHYEVVSYTMVYLITALLVCMGIGLIVLVRRTPILRDSNRHDAPYSLGRTQLAFWTVIIFGCFISIYAITGDLPELRTSTLILLGISLGTTAAARLIDTPQNGTITVVAPPEKSKGFITDILSDGTGISIHRLQMVAWTAIFGFYFMRRAQLFLNIPDIDDSLLTLMGISSAAYVGLKVPENKTAGAGTTTTTTGGGATNITSTTTTTNTTTVNDVPPSGDTDVPPADQP